MKNPQSFEQFDRPLMGRGKAFSVPTGMYHLTYDGTWRCAFVGEGCLALLGCTREAFFPSLRSGVVLLDEGKEIPMGSVLDELARQPGTRFYTGAVRHGNGRILRIKSITTSFRDGNGTIQFYGHAVDITQPYEELALFSTLINQYRSGLAESGKSIYRYLVHGRRAIISTELAEKAGIPDIIENLPQWNVDAGYIAPESVDDWYGIFDAIDRGETHGVAEIIFLIRKGSERRRGRLEFFGISNSSGQQTMALISQEDITDQYERDRLQIMERDALLHVARTVYPELLAVDLTRGTYHMFQYDGATTLGTPREGPLEQMLQLRVDHVAPEDQQAFRDTFFQEGLLKAAQAGKEQVELTYRRSGQDGQWHWMKTIALRQPNPYSGHILYVAFSRNVDKEKQEEEMLRQALEDTSQRMDEWLYYNYLSKQSYPGLVYVSYEDGRLSPYTIGQLAKRFGCQPKALALGTCFRIHPSDKDAVRLAREEAERSGKEGFRAEYRLDLDDGSHVYISNQAVPFVDRNGQRGHIHFLSDTTYEHELSEQVRQYMEAKLEENEQLFNLVAQHSDRTLCYYDIRTQRARPWNERDCDTCQFPHICLQRLSREEFEASEYILPDSGDEARRMFREIHQGVPSGEVNLHVKMPDGGQRWLEFKYSCLLEQGVAAAAVLSFADVTDRHEHTMSYLRYRQSMEDAKHQQLGYMEADLTADLIEAHTELELWKTVSAVGTAYSEFARSYTMGLSEEENQEAGSIYSRDNLLAQYEQGNRILEHIWHLNRPEGQLWVLNKLEMMTDPFTGHVKLFVTMTDVTSDQEERLAVLQRADYDAMTGLLRRGSGEEQIRRALSSGGESGGILIALDLDDLKGINDTLGHNHGDRAIRGIADTLKSHFRKGDILIRAGGDEFMAFLPGAGRSISSVELSMSTLLRKLASIPIGDNNERRIHCSAGCSVEKPGVDTFESLYQRADLALYHVKRSGKNNFAFFDPAMLQEDYHFKIGRAAPKAGTPISAEDTQHLLDTLARATPGIFSLNLTRDYFQVLRANLPAERIPPPDTIEVFWQKAGQAIHPDDRTEAVRTLSRDRLLGAYERGQRTMRHFFRYRSAGDYASTEVMVHFYNTDAGDICAFLFFRPDVAPEQERKVLQLQKILELSGTAEFEYICLINVHDGTYSTFSRDMENTHEVPEIADFNMATRHIRDTQIAPEERDEYFDNAALDRVLAYMNGQEGRYSYRYNLVDGVREAAFTWYESSHSELLMTVRKVTEN